LSSWDSRIVRSGTEAPEQLLANPDNWRIHPKYQQEIMTDILDQVGWVQNVIVNEQTGHVVDGHLRVSVAISKGETEVPVVYVDLTPDEEKLILSSLDPIASLAVTDDGMLSSLLDRVDATGALSDMLSELATENSDNRLEFSTQTPLTQQQIDDRNAKLLGQFDEPDKTRKVKLVCPECGSDYEMLLHELLRADTDWDVD